MGKIMHRLFFYLLRWWADKTYYKLDNPNGVICLIKDRPYDLKITKDTTLRKKEL